MKTETSHSVDLTPIPLAYIWIGDMLNSSYKLETIALTPYYLRGSLQYTQDINEALMLQDKWGGTILEVQEELVKTTTLSTTPSNGGFSRTIDFKFDSYIYKTTEDLNRAGVVSGYQIVKKNEIHRVVVLGLHPTDETKTFMEDYMNDIFGDRSLL